MVVFLISCNNGTKPPPGAYDLTVTESQTVVCSSPINEDTIPLMARVLDVDNPTNWSLIEPDPPTYASGGVILLDIDQDQDVDIMSFSQNQPHLFVNDGVGNFSENNARLPALADAYYNGGSAADFDNDGDDDLYLSTSEGPDVFLEQRENGFVDRSTTIGIGQSISYSAAASWADMDLDGDLDLLVSGYGNDIITETDSDFEEAGPSYLYTNQSGQLSLHASLPPSFEPEPFTFSASWLPLDTSPPLDVLMANDLGPFVHPNTAFINNGSTWAEMSDDAGLNQAIFSMGVAITDWDGDPLPDILITNIGDPVFLSSNGGSRVDITQSIGLSGNDEQITSWGALWFDINNDGSEDLWIGYGPLPLNDSENGPPNPTNQPDRILMNNGSGLVDVAETWSLDRRSNTRGGAMADLNNDGFVDMVRKPIDGPPEIFMNQCNGNAWTSITLDDEKENRSAIGSRLVLHSASGVQQRWILAGGISFVSSFPNTAYFGLGSDTKIDRLEIHWPNGEKDTLENLNINRNLTIRRQRHE